MILAEFDGELEKSEYLRMAVKRNIEAENLVQKQRFQQMKAKYDREGVQYIQDEMELADG